jgi:hypothetical protein
MGCGHPISDSGVCLIDRTNIELSGLTVTETQRETFITSLNVWYECVIVPHLSESEMELPAPLKWYNASLMGWHMLYICTIGSH